MSDENAPATPRTRTRKNEVVEDAVVVDEATGTPVEVETVHASETEPVIATADPAAVETEEPAAQPEHRVVYVQVPPAPAKQGNRGVGLLIVLAASVLFTVLLALITIVINVVTLGRPAVEFLGNSTFYIPTLFFLIAFALVVLVANRANWGAYILGSLVIGLVVYFGSIGLGLLSTGIILNTAAEASLRLAAALGNPFIIVAAVLAREVSMWTGVAIARRGRSVKARNVEARAAYDREVAETRAQHERAAAGAATAV